MGMEYKDMKTIKIELKNELFQSRRGDIYKDVIEVVERPLIEETLERTAGNQVRAAKMLGLNRNTIRSKIKKLGIDLSKWKF